MITVFQNGQQGSRQAMVAALDSVRNQGTAALGGIEDAYTSVLVNLDRRLSAVNARRQKVYRIPTLRVLGKLGVTDFNDIDQTTTTATVRIDSQCVTLRERNQPATADIKATTFSTNLGSVSTMGDLYQVSVMDGSGNLPTGTFNISLFQPLDMSMLVVDIPATPSSPLITVQASPDGITYTPATSVNLSGYRISAYFPVGMQVSYIQIAITPTHPDSLGGTAFTFGITDLSSASVQFQLLSDLISRVILINPASSSLCFVADADPGISFFISFDSGDSFAEIVSGQVVPIPGILDVASLGVAFDPSNTGLLASALPANIYPASLQVEDAATGITIPLAPGMAIDAPNVAHLINQYLSAVGTSMYVVPFVGTHDAGRTFNVSYTYGPATIPVILRAQIITEERALSPIFRGASFQEV